MKISKINNEVKKEQKHENTDFKREVAKAVKSGRFSNLPTHDVE